MTRTSTVSGLDEAGPSGSASGGIRMDSEPGHGVIDGLLFLGFLYVNAMNKSVFVFSDFKMAECKRCLKVVAS